MLHRHLTHQQLALATIDDVIARGRRADWAELRRATLADRTIMAKILCVCQAHVSDPYAQRYHFWKHDAERYLAGMGTGALSSGLSAAPHPGCRAGPWLGGRRVPPAWADRHAEPMLLDRQRRINRAPVERADGQGLNTFNPLLASIR